MLKCHFQQHQEIKYPSLNYKILGLLKKVPSLEGQGTNTIMGGPEVTYGEEETLHSVWEKTKGV